MPGELVLCAIDQSDGYCTAMCQPGSEHEAQFRIDHEGHEFQVLTIEQTLDLIYASQEIRKFQ
jgi:hypothetical protein